MLRISASRGAARGQLRARVAMSAPIRLASTAAVKTTKKSHPYRTVFKTAFYTWAVYTAGAAVALNNDTVQDYYLEYVPGGRKYMDYVQKAWLNRETIVETAGNAVVGAAEKVGLGKLVKLPQKQEVRPWADPHPPLPLAQPETSAPEFEAVQKTETVSSEVESAVQKASYAFEAKIAELTKAAAEKEAQLKEVLAGAGYELPQVDVKSKDKQVNAVVQSVNRLVAAIDAKVAPGEAEKQVAAIQGAAAALAAKYDTLQEDMEQEYAAKVAAAKAALEKQYGEEFSAASKRQAEELTATLTAAKAEIAQKYDKKLKVDVGETAKTIMEEADNIIVQSRVSAVDALSRVVRQKVEQERQGKLQQLDALAARVAQIEAEELELSQTAEKLVTYRQVHMSLEALEQLLATNQPSARMGTALVAELANLRALSAPLHNALVDSALASLPTDEVLLKTGGVLTQSQLISRWEQLTPELRSVSLLPPNAGVLGHISSFLFSKLLVSKSGVPVKGDDAVEGADIESVIARVNSYLVQNQLDNAVEEVSSLKGWPRKLADDWLREGRKKLEIQFLLDVVETEMHVGS